MGNYYFHFHLQVTLISSASLLCHGQSSVWLLLLVFAYFAYFTAVPFLTKSRVILGDD